MLYVLCIDNEWLIVLVLRFIFQIAKHIQILHLILKIYSYTEKPWVYRIYTTLIHKELCLNGLTMVKLAVSELQNTGSNLYEIVI